jgi:ribosomal protein L11 methyltransferase
MNNLTRARFRKADVLHWKPSRLYDIVTANLYSTILASAAPMITEAINPGGALIFSGILVVEEKTILRQFSSAGLKHLKTLKRGKWAAVMMKKPC